MQFAFYHSERRLALVWIFFGILSLAGAGYCSTLHDARVATASLPLLVFGIAFVWLGLLTWRLITRAFLNTDHSGAFRDEEDITPLQKLIDILRRLRIGSAIVLLTGICGILTVCFIESMTYSIGLWLATTIQAAIFSVVILVMTFRLEIHVHEISHQRQDTT